MKLRRLSLTGGPTKEPARSKAVEELLDTDLDLHVRDSSMRSFASSITTPPSQTGSFYHRVQQQHESNESDQQSDYSYEGNHLVGGVPSDLISDTTEDSANTWGGFSNGDTGSDAKSTGSGLDNSVVSSSSQTRRSIKGRKSKSSDLGSSKKKKKKGKKGRKRLKDYFRKSAQQNQPITEVDEDDVVTEEEGKQGSMALIDDDDHDRGAQAAGREGSIAGSNAVGDSDIDSQSEQGSGSNRSVQSRQSRQSIKSNKSHNSLKARAKRVKNKVSARRGSTSSKMSTKSGSALYNNRSKSPKEKPKTKRRGSLGAFKRLSIGGKSEYNGDGMEDPNNPNGVDQETRPRAARRRSSLGNMLGNVVRRASIGARSNNENNTNQNKGPVIPEDFHHIIHRERGARGMYYFHRNIILDTLSQEIANDLASGRAPTPCEFYGNIGKGTSLSLIHSKIMEEKKGISRKNILSNSFKSFGMGCAVGGEKNGSIFMCTLFKE